jgi:hypothetical protein
MPLQLQPPLPPPPAPPPVSTLDASGWFFQYLKKCKEQGNEWLLQDNAFQILKLFEEDETACKLWVMYVEADEGLTCLWLEKQLG